MAYYHWYGWNFITISLPIISLTCLAGIGLNYKGYTSISRLWVCLFVPIVTLSLSIYAKIIYFSSQQELDYFTFRFIMLSSCVFPFVLFTLQEKKMLFASAFIEFSLLILYDPLHSFFGVGYHQNDYSFLSTSTYYFTNIVILITYAILVGTLIFLKTLSEKNEKHNLVLIDKLNNANDELVEKNAEIEAQSMELLAQSEVLNSNQQKLLAAYAEIENHKNQLYKENKNLAAELIEKNTNLTETNAELIKHNNELRQFSFTVSHNLRGPVASLLGLSALLDISKYSIEDQVVLKHVKNSVTHLDSIIHDLSKIIDIRHDIFRIRQKIELTKELKEIERLFRKEIEDYNIKITHDFENCPEIYSVKPMLHSIFYNLISNSIKYRSFERQPEISITSQMGSEHIIIKVKDNGMGIDLAKHKDDLFKLYKRFNLHTEGKGLGLYLVKLQCESLGGRIEVKSEINKYTSFIIYLPKPENIQMQILLNEPFAKIFFDAHRNTTGVIWTGAITSEQYRAVFKKCMEFLRFYNTPNWLSDITNQGPVAPEDQQWLFGTIIPAAAKMGLKRIGAIKPSAKNSVLIEYVNGIRAAIANFGITQQFFDSFEEAVHWLDEENIKASTKK
ncbi:MAG TPA: HAMP domain-containing sensor histidine kinase [Cyclobacteriaceae bacterium]|nr:HAMP domain-containing sensor histidine kinase [Cyclobacteriaceae bacterium]